MNKKILWISLIVFSVGFACVEKYFNTKLEFLLETYKAETRIQSSEIMSLQNSLFSQANIEYQKGFEDGKSQMGFAFMNGNMMFNYSDGYHAAIKQFNTEEFQKIYDTNKDKLINDIHSSEISEKIDNLNSVSKD